LIILAYEWFSHLSSIRNVSAVVEARNGSMELALAMVRFLGFPVCKILSITSSLGLAVVLLETESIRLFETLKTYANMKWLECGIFRLVLD
jgi:hypothetical protein